MKMLTHVALGALIVAGLSACNNSAGQNGSQSHSSQSAYSGPSFDDTIKEAKHRVNAQMALPVTIPVPKDAGGGYTHEKHKENAKLIYDSSALYTLTGARKYADYAAKMMSAYADVYPGWGIHPAKKEQSPGRMFWQNLNESWWLVHVAQGYDAIKDTLSDEQREHIENDLLRNVADFLSEGSPETFDKIHNHGTWATAAVGLTGYAIGDKDYSEKALLGLDKSGNTGFLKQLDMLFSPDGYYNEGPYYQRYALMPFVLFSQAVEKNEPERHIFDYRDGIVLKAIYTTIQLSYNGLFFPINDAIKDKGIATTELVYGVAIAYDRNQDKQLLSIAANQGKFVLTPESRAVSDALVAGEAKPFDYKTMRLRDGANGDQGALDILRASPDADSLTAIAKNTSQGLGHGHFDKLGLLVYDAGHEILSDYGAARFLNVEAKYGGHYLPENNAYAKQTVAHNTLVVDESSHFGGITSEGNKYAPHLGTFLNSDNLKITTADIDSAYEGVTLHRSVAMINDKAFAKPVILDLVSADAEGSHQYDLPFHYNGQLVETNFKLQAYPLSRKPLGTANGYQYLWQTADAKPVDDLSQVTFLLDKRFYSVTSQVPQSTEIIFTETGANDPNFNLRREQAFILRNTQSGGVDYVSVIEPHGEYNPTVEYTLESHSRVKSVRQYDGETAKLVLVTTKQGQKIGLGISQDMTGDTAHTVTVDGEDMSWSGPYHLFQSQIHKDGGS